LYLAISLGEIEIAQHLYVRSKGKLSYSGPHGRNYIWPCSPSPLARPETRRFGPARARPGPVANGPGLARHGAPGRAWADPPARGPARPGTAKIRGPVAGPVAREARPNRQSGPAHHPSPRGRAPRRPHI
jgi:hypothetical protein